jgi:thymidylate kinase
MDRKNFYVIEGLDGVGKTTLIKNLEKNGFTTYKTPPKLYETIRGELHGLREASLFYYLSSLAYTLEVEAENSRDFFLDRYIFSTITQYVSNTTRSIKEFNRLFERLSSLIEFPAITFFIDLDYKRRIERIKGRTVEEKALDNESKSYNDFWIQAIREYNFSRKVILDGTKTEDELLVEVLSYLE